MHFCFVDTLIPQFLTDIPVNSLPLEIVHLHVRFGTLNSRIKDYWWHLWVGGGRRYLGHDIRVKFIAVDFPKVPFQILHCPE